MTRSRDQPIELRGPRVFGYLGASDADRIPAAQRDRLATQIAALGTIA